MRLFTNTSLRCLRMLPMQAIKPVTQGRIDLESSDAGFLSVKSSKIVPNVGLEPFLDVELSGIRLFDIQRARLTNSIFTRVVDGYRCYGTIAYPFTIAYSRKKARGRPETSIRLLSSLYHKHTLRHSTLPALRLTTRLHHRALSSNATRRIHKDCRSLTVQRALSPAIAFRPHNSKHSKNFHLSSMAATLVSPPEAREEVGGQYMERVPKLLPRQRQESIALGRLLRSPNIPSVEAAILSMMNQYRFNPDHLKTAIEGFSSQPRFSNVKDG
jgi:hypothetical protein